MFITVYFTTSKELKYRITEHQPRIYDKDLEINESNSLGWTLVGLYQLVGGKFISIKSRYEITHKDTLKQRIKKFLIKQLEK